MSKDAYYDTGFLDGLLAAHDALCKMLERRYGDMTISDSRGAGVKYAIECIREFEEKEKAWQKENKK